MVLVMSILNSKSKILIAIFFVLLVVLALVFLFYLKFYEVSQLDQFEEPEILEQEIRMLDIPPEFVMTYFHCSDDKFNTHNIDQIRFHYIKIYQIILFTILI